MPQVLHELEALEKKGRAADAFELGVTIVAKQTNSESFSRSPLNSSQSSSVSLPHCLRASPLN